MVAPESLLVSLPFSFRNLLAILSISGQTQPLADTAKMLKKTVTALIETSEELLRSRLVVEDEAGCRIGHPLVRRAVYDSLSTARRRMLHERVAQSLKADDEANWGALAMHFDRAGRAREAVKYSMLAAGFAERSGAIPEAIIHLSIARRNEANVESRSDILWRLGHLHYLRQDLAAAAPILGLSCEGLRAAGYGLGGRTRANGLPPSPQSRLDCGPPVQASRDGSDPRHRGGI